MHIVCTDHGRHRRVSFGSVVVNLAFGPEPDDYLAGLFTGDVVASSLRPLTDLDAAQPVRMIRDFECRICVNPRGGHRRRSVNEVELARTCRGLAFAGVSQWDISSEGVLD